jgi:hypothetical protein
VARIGNARAVNSPKNYASRAPPGRPLLARTFTFADPTSPKTPIDARYARKSRSFELEATRIAVLMNLRAQGRRVTALVMERAMGIEPTSEAP